MTKRERILRRRKIAQLVNKEKRARAFASAKALAEANPTPKPEKTIRIRARNERQIVACDNLSVWAIPAKQLKRLGLIDGNVVDAAKLARWSQEIREQQAFREARNAEVTEAWQREVVEGREVR